VRELVRITKALADPNRVRVLLALRRKELCVCQIVELLRLAPSTISKHLSILNHAGLIVSRKTERWVYYRLPGKEAPVVVREAIAWIHKSLAKTDEARADAKSLKKILNLEPSTLCQRQNGK
jgi:DNA-binding transcriptional ArsR family regulator